MKRILVVSDSHGNNENVKKAIDAADKIDMMIHLGDVGANYPEVEYMCGMPTYIAAGNCDYSGALKERLILTVGKHKIFATHGHRYGVNESLFHLLHVAKENDCDIAMYGHTHIPFLDETGSCTVLNPGSLTFPRQEDFKKTFLVMEIDDDENITYTWGHI